MYQALRFLFLALALISIRSHAVVIAEFNLEYSNMEFRRASIKPKRWFISFLEGDFDDLIISDRFSHTNLGGDSFYIKLSKSSQAELNKALGVRKLYSIWDRVECSRGNLELHKNSHGQHTFIIKNLQQCHTVSDD
jgi:hypothetical protein